MEQHYSTSFIFSKVFRTLILCAAVMAPAVHSTNASELDAFREAAEQGNSSAQFNLGLMYYNGEGVPKDDSEAIRWYRLAAENGNTEAQINLGKMYVDGEGIPKDDSEAIRWFRLAAENGNTDAPYYLGVMFDKAEGIPTDYIQAYAWLNIAAAKGSKEAKTYRKNIVENMSSADIAEAQKLSREYWETYGLNRDSSE